MHRKQVIINHQRNHLQYLSVDKYRLIINAIYAGNHEYLVDTDYPFIVIDFNEGQVSDITQVVIEAAYFEQDREAAKRVLQYKGLL